MLSLEQAVLSLLNSPSQTHLDKSEVSINEKMATTVRIETSVRTFVEEKAQALGISLQDLISLILKAVMLKSDEKNEEKSCELNNIISRFMEVFEEYNIPLFDVPKLFPENRIDLATLNSPQQLLHSIDDSVLHIIESIFLIKQEWLKGLPNVACHKTINMLPDLHNLSREVIHHKEEKADVELIFCHQSDNAFSYLPLRKAKSLGNDFESQEILVVLKARKKIRGIETTVYQVFDSLSWNTEKSRFYLKYAAKLAHQLDVLTWTGTMPSSIYSKFSRGYLMPSTTIKNHFKRGDFDFGVFLLDDEKNPEREELADVISWYNKNKYMEINNLTYAN